MRSVYDASVVGLRGTELQHAQATQNVPAVLYMGEDRLTALALLHIGLHREKDVDVNAVLKAFDASGHRRIALAFKLSIVIIDVILSFM